MSTARNERSVIEVKIAAVEIFKQLRPEGLFLLAVWPDGSVNAQRLVSNIKIDDLMIAVETVVLHHHGTEMPGVVEIDTPDAAKA